MKQKLNLGCGETYLEGWENHDISDKDIYRNKLKVDTTWNLNEYPWIFEDDTYEKIKADAVLEHLHEGIEPYKELKRIGKNGCKIYVRVPHFSGFSGYIDPSHYHKFSFFAGKRIEQMVGLKLIDGKIIFSYNKFLKNLNFLFNLSPRIYERFFAGLIQCQEVEWVFEVEK